jgi:diguanylate cyclase (GGDEF)-like protein
MRWYTNIQIHAVMLAFMLFVGGVSGAEATTKPAVKPAAKQEATHTEKQGQAVQPASGHAASSQPAAVSTEVPAEPGQNYSLALSVLVGLELLGIAYLIFQLKKIKTELTTERQQHVQISQKLEYQAMYDALTQLPNRRLFRDRLLQTMKIYNRHKTQFGVIMCDLDHFKEVNDTLGHDAGDMLLVEVTTRLRKALRDSDTLARLGGDEFALICPSVQDLSTASVICMRLLEAMRDPIVIKGHAFDIGLSLGIAVFPEHASDDEMLVRRADMALYRAKQKRGTFVMFDPNIDRPKKRAEKKEPPKEQPAEGV